MDSFQVSDEDDVIPCTPLESSKNYSNRTISSQHFAKTPPRNSSPMVSSNIRPKLQNRIESPSQNKKGAHIPKGVDRILKQQADDMVKILLADPEKHSKVLEFLSSQGITSSNPAEKNPGVIRKDKKNIRIESPSALCRRRQLERLNSASSGEDAPKPKNDKPVFRGTPKPFNQLLKGIVAYCEVRSKDGDRSEAIKAMMRLMGATVLDTFTRNVTHVVFKDGMFSTFQKAKLLKVHLVSVLWLEAVRKHKFRVPECKYPALNVEAFDADVSLICRALQEDYDEIVNDEYRKQSHYLEKPGTSAAFVTERRKKPSHQAKPLPSENAEDYPNQHLDYVTPDVSPKSTRSASSDDYLSFNSQSSQGSEEVPATKTSKKKLFTEGDDSTKENLTQGQDNIAKYARNSLELQRSMKIRSPQLLHKSNASESDLLKLKANNKNTLSLDDKEDSSMKLHITTTDESNVNSTNNKSRNTSPNAQTSAITTTSNISKDSTNKSIDLVNNFIMKPSSKRGRKSLKNTKSVETSKEKPVNGIEKASKKVLSKASSGLNSNNSQNITSVIENTKSLTPKKHKITENKSEEEESEAPTPPKKRNSTTENGLDVEVSEERPNKENEITHNAIANNESTSKETQIDGITKLPERDTTKNNDTQQKRFRRLYTPTDVIDFPSEWEKNLTTNSSKKELPSGNVFTMPTIIPKVTSPIKIQNIKKKTKDDTTIQSGGIAVKKTQSTKKDKSFSADSTVRKSRRSVRALNFNDKANEHTDQGINSTEPVKPRKSIRLLSKKSSDTEVEEMDTLNKSNTNLKTPKGNRITESNLDSEVENVDTLNKSTTDLKTPKRNRVAEKDLDSELENMDTLNKSNTNLKTPKRNRTTDIIKPPASLLRRSIRLSVHAKTAPVLAEERSQVLGPALETDTRRSTLDFVQKPSRQSLARIKSTQKPKINNKVNSIVCTRLHKPDVQNFENIVKQLGSFIIESNVTGKTTHLVAGAPSRTVNMLRAMARGCWILRQDWLVKSADAGKWLPEEEFEMVEFSTAVQKCRLQKQSFGPLFSLDIFKECDPIYIGRNSVPRCRDLEELVSLCEGNIVRVARQAKIIVGEFYRYDNVVCVNERWILDSITYNKRKSIKNYLLSGRTSTN